jgi:large subunit ribosomal protein L25
MANESTRLNATVREIEGSRANRRLRREGRVPAVLYGGDAEPVALSVDARELRHALHGAGAVLEIEVDGEMQNAVVKDTQVHPVRHEALHIDFVRVRMDVAIHSIVTLELVGAEDSPGTDEGGVLEQQLREVNVEALPGDIPETIQHDVSKLEMGATVTVADVTAPQGVTILDDEELVVASITLPRLEVETEEPETETEVVGEGEEAAEGEAAEGASAEGGDEGGAESPDSDSE